MDMNIKLRRQKNELARRKRHRKWQVQEAKAKFSQLVNETVSFGYQTITKNGEPVAYLVSKEEFDLYLKPQKSLLEVFDQCPHPEVELDIDRGKERFTELVAWRSDSKFWQSNLAH
jgi:prevent-host-death family protein